MRRALLVVVIALAGCGSPAVVDLCPGAPCSVEGRTVDLFPGCAVCRDGAWTVERDGAAGCVDLGHPLQCSAGLPSKVTPSACTYESVACAPGVGL